jgi:octaprenyl-diphosphate synthase
MARMNAEAAHLRHVDAAAAGIGDMRAVQALIADEMTAVDALIRERLSSDVPLVNSVAEHIIAAGGKRLRPSLVLLAAGAAGYKGHDHRLLAAIIEFIHTATLLHDDVVDESDRRRGRRTANAIWGNAASVLVGDFLYSRAFQLMVEADRMEIMRILADTTNAIAEGEVLQLMYVRNPDTDEAAYLEVIKRKTAVLFAAATRLGGVLAGVPAALERALHDYGLNLGLAFQIADDVLDYTADTETLGKNLGDDLAEGKPTLPVICALARSDGDARARLRQAIEKGDTEHLPAMLALIRDSGALHYCHERALGYADRALAALESVPPSPQREALEVLARYAVGRNH